MDSKTHHAMKLRLDVANAAKKAAIYTAPEKRFRDMSRRQKELQEDINRLMTQIDEIEERKALCFATILVLEQGQDGLYMSDLVEAIAKETDAPTAEFIKEAEERGEIEKHFEFNLDEYIFHITTRLWRRLGY